MNVMVDCPCGRRYCASDHPMNMGYCPKCKSQSKVYLEEEIMHPDKLKKSIVFYDLETTGVGAGDEIIQYAAVAYSFPGLDEIDSLEYKVQPGSGEALQNLIKLSKEKPEVCHWKPEVWAAEQACDQKTGIKFFTDWLAPYCWVPEVSTRTGTSYRTALMAGTNISFDERFIRRAIKVYSPGRFVPFHHVSLDLQQFAIMAQWLDPLDNWKQYPTDSYLNYRTNLKALSDKFCLKQENAHDALADVRQTAELFGKVLREIHSSMDSWIRAGKD